MKILIHMCVHVCVCVCVGGGGCIYLLTYFKLHFTVKFHVFNLKSYVLPKKLGTKFTIINF